MLHCCASTTLIIATTLVITYVNNLSHPPHPPILLQLNHHSPHPTHSQFCPYSPYHPFSIQNLSGDHATHSDTVDIVGCIVIMSRARGNRRGRRGRGRGNRSRGHSGRDLRRAEDIIDSRLAQFPNQSFAKIGGKLTCQACNKYLDHTRKSLIQRHCGLDERQNVNTNKGSVHRNKLQEWNDGGDEQVDYSDIRSGFVMCCMMNGVNAQQTAGIAKDFFGRYHMDNSATIPSDADGMYFISVYMFCVFFVFAIK